jgi:hypothetical protein
VRAINIANDKNLPEFPTLMFEFIGTGKAGCLFKYLTVRISLGFYELRTLLYLMSCFQYYL